MDPADPKRTDLPDIFSSEAGSSVPTLQRQAQGHTLPSAHVTGKSPTPSPETRRGGHEVQIVSAVQPAQQQVTMPSGALSQLFRPSPAMVALGGEIAEWAPPGLVRVRFPAHEGWSNGSGSLSAGFVVAMMEPVYAALAHAVAPMRQSAVVETSVRFFRAIRGGYVVVDGTVLRAGSTTVTIECTARDSGGELCAKGSATLMLIG
jgi:uncharacterized protein (TIGR00369 family)